MGRLIADLLAFSRFARKELERRSVDLGALAARVWQELKLQRELVEPGAKNRVICWKLLELPTVEADESMLRQVFINLFSNAVKYTRGRATAEIEVGSVTRSPGEVAFYVRDNGVGFDMRYAEKLFGMFQRLHGAEEFEGNGVGLANVRRVIQRHGGRIWAEAEVGKGATFYFALPTTIV
jgi:light-regulated signal transduction histidine kinase (bacteriophytochrome)